MVRKENRAKQHTEPCMFNSAVETTPYEPKSMYGNGFDKYFVNNQVFPIVHCIVSPHHGDLKL